MQVALWLAVVGTGVSQIVVAHRGAVSGVRLARVLHRASRGQALRILRASAPSPLAHLADAVEVDDGGQAQLALQEGVIRARREVVRGVAALRILGLVCSAVGFVAVAHQISWLSSDHGLLDLDPVRVGRMAVERATIALSLTLAGSGTAVGLAAVVRARVRAGLRDLDAVQNAIERALPRWTAGQGEC